jgi:DNA-binding GntR family transcriptional regulator
MSYGTLGRNAYRTIHRKIVSGQLPAGQVVSEESLAREIGISRTPVREAIRRLHLEGLVDQVPRYGTLVHTPDPREVRELYELLEPMYAWVGTAAARRITEEHLQLMQRLSEQMHQIARALRDRGTTALRPHEVHSWLELDAIFYMVPVAAAGNRQIARVIRACRAQLRIVVQTLPPFELRVLARLYRLHGRLIRALRRHDPAQASRILVQTIDCRRWIVCESFADARESQAVTPIDEELAEELSLLEDQLVDSPPGRVRRRQSPPPPRQSGA